MRTVHYKHCGHVVNSTQYGLHRSGTFAKTQVSWILKNQGNPELFAMITQGIWHQGNQVCTHKPCCTSDQLISQVKEKLVEFLAILPPKPPIMPRPRVKWKPPNTSCFKINFDKAIFRNENISGIGVVFETTLDPSQRHQLSLYRQHFNQLRLKQLQQHGLQSLGMK